MVKKSSDFFEMSETGNWNVAIDFTKFKIFKLLIEADEYEKIATFGTSEIIEEFVTDESTRNLAKITAVSRLLKTLQMLINNTKFAVKKDDKESMEKYLKTLMVFKKYLPLIESVKLNKINHTQTIETTVCFKIVLDVLVEIKAELLIPLNEADLIFSKQSSFDPDEFKRQIKEDMIFSG